MWRLGAFILCVLLQHSLQFTSDSLKVKLDHGGILVGRHMTTIHGRHVRAFQSVPYAQPPTGDLRFKAPVPYQPWEGEKYVTENTPACIQINPFIHSKQIEGVEDCLYLNVYTPPLEDIEESGPLPVMVWFHGGGWKSGLGGDQLYGPKYLLDKNVILVSGNYRLGIFGFLSTETLDCPGNFGLKDQLEILRWVKENIKAFGGNPDSVTIFGESAGGASVAYHMLSEKSNKLFHRGIQQSGTNFHPWAVQRKEGSATAKALKLGEFNDCKGSFKEIIACLRKIPAEQVISRFYDFFDYDVHPTMPFPSVVEPDHPEAFVTSNPRTSDLKSSDKPLMIGLTSQEGIVFSAALFKSNQIEAIKRSYKHLFPIILHYDHLPKSQKDHLTEEIDAFYFKNGHGYTVENHENITNLFSDSVMNSAVDEYLRRRLPAAFAPTYTYIFDHLGSASASEVFGGEDLKMGVAHADELQYLFSWEDVLRSAVPTKRDIAIREAMIEMWVNFATYGNPTPAGSSLPVWKPTKQHDQWNYVRIGSRTGDESYIIRNEENFEPERLAFWRRYDPFFGDGFNGVKDEL